MALSRVRVPSVPNKAPSRIYEQMNHFFFLDSILNGGKDLKIALASIKGLGYKRSKLICRKLGFQDKISFEDLDSNDTQRLKTLIEKNFIINKKLVLKVASDIDVLCCTKSYRGHRHKLGLCVRGQRTKTNSKTQYRLARSRLLETVKAGSSSKSQKIAVADTVKVKKKKPGTNKKRRLLRKKIGENG